MAQRKPARNLLVVTTTLVTVTHVACNSGVGTDGAGGTFNLGGVSENAAVTATTGQMQPVTVSSTTSAKSSSSGTSTAGSTGSGD